MGDVVDLKKPPKDKGGDDGKVRILSCNCGQATWIVHVEGRVECPICGAGTTIIYLMEKGFFS